MTQEQAHKVQELVNQGMRLKRRNAASGRCEMTKTITNPLKVIREKCIDCSGGSKHEADLCQATNCPLFDWRFGKNPNRKKREMTEEQKQLARHVWRKQGRQG